MDRTASWSEIFAFQTKSWRGSPDRWESISDMVICVVDQVLFSTKSSGMMVCTGVSHWIEG